MESSSNTVAVQIRGLTPASKVLAGVACIVLFSMMLLTFADVMGRYVFLAPLPAAYEMVSLMMPAIIFCALPLTMLRETHVTVDLLDAFIPSGLARIQAVIVNVISAIALALVTWRLAIKTRDDLSYETVTDELLLLVWPFGAGMTVLCAIATLAALASAWTYAAGTNSRIRS
jgi:TRAP-type C4-dicarboxylate transport system permease small subunit